MEYDASSNKESIQMHGWDFIQTTRYKERFFLQHPFLNDVESVVENCTTELLEGNILYRARICDDEFMKKNFKFYKTCIPSKYGKEEFAIAPIVKNYSPIEANFYGYDKINSSAPTNQFDIKDGRVNPQFIRYLYTARSAYTAMVEVRPIIRSVVSIAKMKVNYNLKIMSFAGDLSKTNMSKVYVCDIMRTILSSPSNGNAIDYIPSQCIGAFIKSLGFDGIEFPSSLDPKGYNIVIFDPEKCEAIESNPYQVWGIEFKADCICPNDNTTALRSLESYP